MDLRKITTTNTLNIAESISNWHLRKLVNFDTGAHSPFPIIRMNNLESNIFHSCLGTPAKTIWVIHSNKARPHDPPALYREAWLPGLGVEPTPLDLARTGFPPERHWSVTAAGHMPAATQHLLLADINILAGKHTPTGFNWPSSTYTALSYQKTHIYTQW